MPASMARPGSSESTYWTSDPRSPTLVGHPGPGLAKSSESGSPAAQTLEGASLSLRVLG